MIYLMKVKLKGLGAYYLTSCSGNLSKCESDAMLFTSKKEIELIQGSIERKWEERLENSIVCACSIEEVTERLIILHGDYLTSRG